MYVLSYFILIITLLIQQYNLAVKRNEVLMHRTTWVNFKIIILSERRQRRIRNGPSHRAATGDSAASPLELPRFQRLCPLPPTFSGHCLPRKRKRNSISTKEKESYCKSAIQDLQSSDAFADASKGDDLLPAGTEDYIHTRIRQKMAGRL